MIFTEEWSKDDNKLYRKMIKEKKSISEIVSIIGLEKLKNKPNGYFSSGGVLKNFNNFLINEIVYTEKYTEFNLNRKKSKYFDGYDYIFTFKTNSLIDYVFEFVYYIDTIGPFAGFNLYNLSFTTLNQKILSDVISDDKIKTDIYEKPTEKNELHELMKRLIYIFNHFYNYYGRIENSIYVIGETLNPQKMNFYKNLISSSFENIDEIKGDSSINSGLPVYYYKIIL